MKYETFVIGRLNNNCYVLHAIQSKQAAIIDPADEIEPVIDYIKNNQLDLKAILITHAHFDHILGCNAVRAAFPSALLHLHKDDEALWLENGNARLFGIPAKELPRPDVWLQHGDIFSLGEVSLQVFHTPGHTPGHVVFFAQDPGLVFCGDLIFANSVGRTDLPGGNERQLLKSIQTQIFTLPESTFLLPGHGEITTVGEEKSHNPYVRI